MPRPPLAAIAPLFLIAFLGACRSAEGWREQADSDVYRLVRDRRAKLAIGDGSFTIEPPKDSLRERLLRGESAETAPLTLVQCLEIAAENSRDYRSREERLYLSALDLTLERWNFHVQNLGVVDAHVDGTGDTADAMGVSTGLSQLLGTGALIVGDIGLDLTRDLLTSGDGWHPVGTLGLSITQPLLRGFGKDIVQEPLTQAERDLVYAVRSFERYRRTFAFDVAGRFYALLVSQDEAKNQETNYENLQKLSDRNAALAEAGRLDDIQAGQAKQDELRSRDNLLQARASLELQKDQFKIFLGLPPQIDLAYDSAELERLSEQDLSPIDLDPEEAAGLALATRLDHLNAVDQSRDGERHVAVAEDALRAGLTLGAVVRQPSETGKPAKFDFRDSNWSLTAALDLPINRLPERNAYRTALIAAEAARRAVEESADDIRAALRDELRETKSKLESWRIQLNAVELATRRIDSTDLKLQAGRAVTRDLLEAQESLLEARNAASTALIDYTLSRLALFRDLELLRVDENGIRADVSGLPGRTATHRTDGDPQADPVRTSGLDSTAIPEAGA